jgi:hypothetical protein
VLSSPEIEFNKGYKIFPTPVKDNLTIESTGNVKSLELFDFQGRRLRDIEINSTTYQLDMSSFTPGIYIIQLKSADGNFVQKIAKE